MPDWEPAPPSAVLKQMAERARKDSFKLVCAGPDELDRLAADVAAMEQQRAEMLNALRAIAKMPDVRADECSFIARATLARIEKERADAE